MGYLNCKNHSDLASNGYFDDPQFISYLDYLSYWKTPQYAKFIM